MTGSDALLFEHSAQVVALAARHATPAIYSYGVIVNAGGLISYGSIPEDAFRLVGVHAGRILKGEKPADLSFPRFQCSKLTRRAASTFGRMTLSAIG